jgi:homoserine kinase
LLESSGRERTGRSKGHMGTSCTAAAPASTANLGPGFDVFGLGLDALEDIVKIDKIPGTSRQVSIHVSGENYMSIPADADYNSAGLVIKKICTDFNILSDLQVAVLKRVPAGFGMGSSAASAAAAAIALDGLFELKIEKEKLIEYAAEGEIASAGTKHYDNVSGAILGGFVIVRTRPQLEFIRIAPPRNLVLVIAVPAVTQSARKTEIARSVLPEHVPLRNVVHNVSAASTVVAGFALNNIEMIARGIDDVIVEPARMIMIPSYDAVKRNALRSGALAVTISGAGPSMISFLNTDKNALTVAQSMASGFREAKIESRTYVCKPSGGAKIISTIG